MMVWRGFEPHLKTEPSQFPRHLSGIPAIGNKWGCPSCHSHPGNLIPLPVLSAMEAAKALGHNQKRSLKEKIFV